MFEWEQVPPGEVIKYLECVFESAWITSCIKPSDRLQENRKTFTVVSTLRSTIHYLLFFLPSFSFLFRSVVTGVSENMKTVYA